MAVVASITLDKEGRPTSGPGDVLIGDRAEHVEAVRVRLANIAHGAGVDVPAEEITAHAEAIVDQHTPVAVNEAIPAEVAAPAPVQAPAE